MFKFKLLRGRHAESVSTNNPEQPGETKLVIFNKGDRFESNSELDKKFNSSGSVKFERLDDDAKVSSSVNVAANAGALIGNTSPAPGLDNADVDLQNKTVAELKAIASEFEIDLGQASKKDDIIKVLVANGV